LGYTEKQIKEFKVEQEKRQKEQIELQREKFAAGGPPNKKPNGDSKVIQ
jgi:hypothetical protein